MSATRASVEAVADTSGRILRLLSLLSARVEWSGAELAQRLRVSARTLRRDVETLLSAYDLTCRSGYGLMCRSVPAR